jgi:transcriptional regulator with XRE-family HTH domain
MSSIGDTLRRERLRRGWTLKQVADETKIRPHLLEALEEDRLNGLPSALLTRSFARQYARALGLDKEALVSVERQIEELAAQIPEPKPWRNSAHIPLLQPYILNEEGSINSPSNPAARIARDNLTFGRIHHVYRNPTAAISGVPAGGSRRTNVGT